jgi:hypothetical protein
MATLVNKLVPSSPRGESKSGLAHLAHYAVACNRIICGLRHPRDRIFQVGGRRRLLFASAVNLNRLDAIADTSKAYDRQATECEALADFAVAVSDGIFRKQGDKTAVRLLCFLVNRLNHRWTPCHQRSLEDCESLQQTISNADRKKVAQLLAKILDRQPANSRRDEPPRNDELTLPNRPR